MAAQGRDIKMSTTRLESYRNFATKIWNACRFLGIMAAPPALAKSILPASRAGQ